MGDPGNEEIPHLWALGRIDIPSISPVLQRSYSAAQTNKLKSHVK